MKKIVCLTCFILALGPATYVFAADADIPRAAGSITIDGIKEAAWLNAPQHQIANVIQGAASKTACSGSWRALWDSKYFYVFFDVNDDALVGDSTTLADKYNDDSVEVFFDIGNTKAASYGANDYQYRFGWDPANPTLGTLGADHGNSTVGIDRTFARTGTGYSVEVRVPWSTLSLSNGPAIGDLVGFEAQINDDDNGGARDNQLDWHSTTNDAWQYPNVFGTVAIVAGSIAIAVNPDPLDEATDVVRDVVLSWTPGCFTPTHNVYFGTSFNDVNTATASSPLLVSKNQDVNTYDPPGLLAFGTTYYWRVDEVNTSADHTVFAGDVWSFTTEPVAYPLANVTATASSSQTGYSPQYAVDKSGLNANDQHDTTPTTMWLSDKNATGLPWIQCAFDQVYKLTEMWIWNYNAAFETEFLGFGIKTADVTYSTDGTNWTAFGSVTFNQGASAPAYACNNKISLGGIAAKYVKISAKSNFAGRNQYGLSEVRFYYIPVMAREPQPASGATGVSPNGVVLAWRGGREAASHQIQFSTDSNAVSNGTALLASTGQTAYALNGLDLGKTYYWRIDEVNAAASPSVRTGNVWNFTTASYIVVDDMESYNDTTNKIFDTWVDGYGTTTNGSLVGYATSVNGTFGERTIVHGGRQSMPYAYSNTGTFVNSEATRTWTTPVDWTTNKADTLRLFVQGRPIALAETSPGTITMSGAGLDIYQLTDQFRFAYKQLTGNGSITARIDSIQNTNTWAKVGVMIRVGTTVGAMQVHMVDTPGQGVEFMPRLTAGTNATGTATGAGTNPPPRWVRLTRNGTTFTGEYSADGKTWTQVAGTTPATIAMTDPVLIGLVVSSHLATTLCEARFSSVSTTGNVTGQWQLAEVGTTQPVGNTPDTLYITVSDSTGHSATLKNADPYASTNGAWTEWRIPFTSFTAVGMNRVKSMVIGVGDKSNPQHGVGQLFIDDIGVGHSQQ